MRVVVLEYEIKKSLNNMILVSGIESIPEPFIEPAQENIHMLLRAPITKHKQGALNQVLRCNIGWRLKLSCRSNGYSNRVCND